MNKSIKKIAVGAACLVSVIVSKVYDNHADELVRLVRCQQGMKKVVAAILIVVQLMF